MPPTKRNKKGNRRGNPAARAAQPRPRPAGTPPTGGTGASTSTAPSGAPPSSSPAPTVPPGLTSKKTSPGSSSAPAVPPGLTSKKTSPGKDLPVGLTSANNGLDRSAAPLIPPVTASARSAPAATASAASTPTEPETTPADPADDMPKWAAKAVEELLTPTYWLDPGESGEPFSATIRFSGRRTDVTGKPEPRDSFWQEETVDEIIPGSGPVAVTAEVRGINPGDWTMTARSVARTGGRSYRSYPPPGHDPAGVYRVPPPRRVEIPAEATATIHTSTLLRSKVPGIIRFAYATLVGLGVLVGLGLEALLLNHGHYTLFRPMLFSVIAIIAGVIGGKAWYVAVHRGRKFDGWCIQGFVAGAAVVVAAAALAGPGIPAGAYLAAAAPALLIGMSIGRPGCFWAGCCTGRPTAARWGVWSSDRRLGCRRAPAQLLEALSALISGGVVLIVVLVDGLARSGPVAVVGLAAYTLARQFILGLRAEDRVWPYGRRVTGAIAALALIAGIILLIK
ncbi:MAG TPA: prolipoprotein diacylglyceryl transferase family protein [Streptosporangiaceae bacterium]|nr:prolipoprotein diacylglyceryl transferase family protein [Streptosporangiaceae bacterium]